jgi:hypothetical protein
VPILLTTKTEDLKMKTELSDEQIDQCWGDYDNGYDSGYGLSRYDITRAIIAQHEAQRQAVPSLKDERDKWKMVDADCRDGTGGLLTYHVDAFDEGFTLGRMQRQAGQETTQADKDAWNALREKGVLNGGQSIADSIRKLPHVDTVACTPSAPDKEMKTEMSRMELKAAWEEFLPNLRCKPDASHEFSFSAGVLAHATGVANKQKSNP